MKVIRKYISLFVLLLVLFPIGEKAMHDVEHFNEDHCEIKETHYCKLEHDCPICDYIFSFPSSLPKQLYQVSLFSTKSGIITSYTVGNLNIIFQYVVFLRGPPGSLFAQKN
jgi:hypothetical protein